MSETSLPRHRLNCICTKCKIAPVTVALSYNAEGFLFLDLMCPQCLEKLTVTKSLFELMEQAINLDNGVSKPLTNDEIVKAFMNDAKDKNWLKGLRVSAGEDEREEE